MRVNRRGRQGRTVRAAVLATTAAAALAAAAPALAELPAYGMVPVSGRQTAVLHAVLTHEPSLDHPGCWVTASFVDARGDTLKDRAGNEITASWVLRDNVAQALPVRGADVLGEGERRTLIRAAVRETPNPGSSSDCCALTLTLEIRNSTGATADLILPRQPNPPAPICSVR
jgi:hypothetical protein